MKSKNMIILVVVLAVLVVIYLAQNMGSDKMTVSESLLDLYPDFNSSSVTAIKAYKQDYPDSGLMFVKQDNNWLVESYYNAPAKVSEIEKLFTDIDNLQGEIRSLNQDLFSDYDIEDAKALHVEFLGSDNSEIAHILFGKGVPQASRSSFLRNYGQDTVYMGSENFISRFAAWNADPAKRLPAKRWVEMKLADFDKESSKQIELVKGKTKYLFEKQEQSVMEDTVETTKEVWVQVKPSKDKLDEMKIDGILSRIGALRAMEIVSGEILPDQGLVDPKYIAGVTLKDGATQVFSFGAETDTTSSAYYVKVEGRPLVYKVAKFNFEAIFDQPFEKK